MFDRHKFAIKTNDEQNWLADNINLLTEEERKHYWSTVRANLETEMELHKMFEIAKGRCEK